MSDAATALLRAIRDDPDDDLPRLALADCLEESDDPDRAEFIRVQCELARLPDHDPARPPLEDREHDLLAANEPRWLGDAGSGLVEWEFRRGFLDEVAADPIFLAERGPDLFAAHPVRRWRVMGSADAMHEDLVAAGRSAWARRLEAIDLSGWFETIGQLERFLTRSDLPRLRELNLVGRPGLDDLPGVLARSPFAAGLKVLRCGGAFDRLDADDLGRALSPLGTALTELSAAGCMMTADDLRVLLSYPLVRELTRLDVADNDLAPDAWTGFRPARLRLRELDLSGTPLGAFALGDLLGCESLSELRSLELNRCGSAVANVRALAGSRYWGQAEELRLYAGTAPEHAFDPVFAAAGPPALRTLDLGENFLRDAGVARLCESKWAGNLTWLSLASNYLTDESLRAMARSGRFTNLRTLHLQGVDAWREGVEPEVEITDVGVRDLASSPSLANLRRLVLTASAVTVAGLDAALNGLHWRLSGLGAQSCRLTRADVWIIANSPPLARLEWLDPSENWDLGGDALMPLAESEYLSPLLELDVRNIPLAPAVRQAFRERLGRRFSE